MKNNFDTVISALNEKFPDFSEKFAGFSQSSMIDTNFLGLDLSQTPTWGWNWTILIPIISALTSLLISLVSMRLNRDPSGEKQPAGCDERSYAFHAAVLLVGRLPVYHRRRYVLDHIQPSFRCSDDSTLLFV